MGLPVIIIISLEKVKKKKQVHKIMSSNAMVDWKKVLELME